MWERKLLLSLALTFGVLGIFTTLTGCATIQNGAQRVQLPAIVALEAAAADTFRKSLAKVEGDELTGEAAVELQAGANTLMQRIGMARFAYDVTIGDAASPAVKRQVNHAREATDVAYRELLLALSGRYAVNYTT